MALASIGEERAREGERETDWARGKAPVITEEANAAAGDRGPR